MARHRQDALGVGEVIFESVLGKLAGNRVAGSARAEPLRAAALDHETVDDPVKDQTVVKSFFDEADEIVDGVRRGLGVELRLDDAAVFHCDRYDWVLCHCRILSSADFFDRL